ncbi:MAG: hypothetical protein R3F43_20990 [bacterium]
MDALLVDLSIELAGDAGGPRAEHIVEVALDVDGEAWGRCELAAPLPDAGTVVDGWHVLEAPRSALLVARLTADADAADAPPDTIGAWLDLLDRTLEPGAHAARITRVVVEDEAGGRRTLRSDAWLPFDVALGAGQAWIGAVTLTLEADR